MLHSAGASKNAPSWIVEAGLEVLEADSTAIRGGVRMVEAVRRIDEAVANVLLEGLWMLVPGRNTLKADAR